MVQDSIRITVRHEGCETKPADKASFYYFITLLLATDSDVTLLHVSDFSTGMLSCGNYTRFLHMNLIILVQLANFLSIFQYRFDEVIGQIVCETTLRLSFSD
jgi:hypothetical protein